MPLFSRFNHCLITLLLLLSIAIIGVFKLTANANYLVYFDANDNLVQHYLDKKQRFAINDSLILIVQSKDHSPLIQSDDFYNNSKKLLKSLKQLPQTNNTQSFLAQLRWRNDVFLSTQKSKTKLLSADESAGLIILDVQLSDNKNAKQILAFNQTVLQTAKSSYQDENIEFYLSGELGLNNAYISTVRHDIKRFIPFLFLSMFAVLVGLLRNVKIALSMLAVGVLSTLSSFGIIGWLGYPLASINVFTPIMIIGLSVVTNMHNTLAFYQYIGAGESKENALKQSFRENFTPLSMSCLTTALGFLFLLNSPSPPIVVTGIASAIGIVISLCLSLTFYQKMLFITAPSQSKANKCLPIKNLTIAVGFFTKYKVLILVCSVGLLVLGSIGLTKLSINDNVYGYFPKDYNFRQSIDLLDKKFSGVVSVDYVVTAKFDNQSLALKQWNKAQWDDLKIFYSTLSNIPNIKSIYPPISLLNETNVNNFYRQKNTSKSALHTYLDIAGHSFRIQIRLAQMSSKQILALDQLIMHNTQTLLLAPVNNSLDKVNTSAPTLLVSRGTSADILFANVGFNNAKSMFSSLIVALSIISVITGLLLRSWLLCAFVFVCNFLPIIIAYGLLGISGGFLTLGSTVVIGMIIGIIVDDTLHLLFKFVKYQQSNENRQSLQQNGLRSIDAIIALQKRVFPAVIISSFIIMLALSIGLLSDFKPTFEISFFSILVILLALFTDLLLLPVLLKLQWVEKHFSNKLKDK